MAHEIYTIDETEPFNEQRPHQALNYKVPAEVYGQMHSGFMGKFSNLSTIPLCQPQLIFAK